VKICLICTEKLPLPPVRGGAIQAYINGVAPYLSERHQITVVGRTDPDLPDQERTAGVNYVRMPAGDRPSAYFQAVQNFIATERFDVIEVFNRPAYLPMLFLAAPKTPFLLSLHNEMMDPNRIDEGIAQAVLDRVSGVAAISDFIRDGINKAWPGYEHKVKTIRSGVDLARYQPTWDAPTLRNQVRRRLGLEGKPVVLHVSRLSIKKGNHLVIAAMRQVRRHHPDAALLVVGSRWYGSDEPDAYVHSLWAQAKELGEGAVCFTGFVPPDHLPEIFLAGDLFVNASQWEEPLARVHYEAMAAGLPIITTARGGNPEVVVDGHNGLFARPFDHPEGFETAICNLLDQPVLREQLGRRGRTLAEERYSFRRVAQELEEVLVSCAWS
jgi:spore coat protein SA